jgi:hypothetical protein
MMNLNIFRKRSKACNFDSEDWRFDDGKQMFCLILSVPKTKITHQTVVYLYKKQGDRYIFMSEGFEAINGSELVYYALSPFGGKIRIK